ncbi:hypothetical protein HNR39_000939 [Glaciimonas immobilis]|uniref:Uncharacterized protein n=1 Tax=Glaciimonas immobilis TaxID=728004 RepID=A0A840RPP4_9BURK|nr:hypothetical protein [Glaciimonas immobilis]
MGDYLRYNSAIGNSLSEFVILFVAREWTHDYDWYVQYWNGNPVTNLSIQQLHRPTISFTLSSNVED